MASGRGESVLYRRVWLLYRPSASAALEAVEGAVHQIREEGGEGVVVELACSKSCAIGCC